MHIFRKVQFFWIYTRPGFRFYYGGLFHDLHTPQHCWNRNKAFCGVSTILKGNSSNFLRIVKTGKKQFRSTVGICWEFFTFQCIYFLLLLTNIKQEFLDTSVVNIASLTSEEQFSGSFTLLLQALYLSIWRAAGRGLKLLCQKNKPWRGEFQ